MKGGALDCSSEEFNDEMREASLGMGKEYNSVRGLMTSLHANGEMWTFDQLVNFSNGGILNWYASRLDKTDAELAVIKEIPALQILGAFYHRYKIVAENLDKLRGILRGGLKEMFRGVPKYNSYTGPDSFSRYAATLTKPGQVDFKRDLNTLATAGDDLGAFMAKDLPLETAIDRAQCLMFYTVKHGKLPDGFVMDDRIEQRAREPVLCNETGEGLSSTAGGIKLEAALKWITFLNEAFAELNPNEANRVEEVKFGVF